MSEKGVSKNQRPGQRGLAAKKSQPTMVITFVPTRDGNSVKPRRSWEAPS